MERQWKRNWDWWAAAESPTVTYNYFDLNEAMVHGTYENVRRHIQVFNMEAL